MTASMGKDVEKLEASFTAGGNANGSAMLENSLEVPQMVKHTVTV